MSALWDTILDTLLLCFNWNFCFCLDNVIGRKSLFCLDWQRCGFFSSELQNVLFVDYQKAKGRLWNRFIYKQITNWRLAWLATNFDALCTSVMAILSKGLVCIYGWGGIISNLKEIQSKNETLSQTKVIQTPDYLQPLCIVKYIKSNLH